MATHTIRSVRRFFVEHFDFLYLIGMDAVSDNWVLFFTHERHNSIRLAINYYRTIETMHQCFVVYTFAYVTHSVYFWNIWVFFILDTSVNNFM